MPPSSRNIKDTLRLTPSDPKTIRQHIGLVIRHLSSVHDRDTPRQTHVIVNEIWQFVAYASLQLTMLLRF